MGRARARGPCAQKKNSDKGPGTQASLAKVLLGTGQRQRPSQIRQSRAGPQRPGQAQWAKLRELVRAKGLRLGRQRPLQRCRGLRWPAVGVQPSAH